MTPQQIATSLGNPKKQGNGSFNASCPVPSHGRGNGDKNPSLNIDVGDDGNYLFKCFSGCEQRNVFDTIRSLGLLPQSEKYEPLANVKPLPKPVEVVKTRDLEAEWHYTDEDGQTLFIKERYKTNDAKGKTYRNCQLMANGQKKYTLADVRIVPYRLPQLLLAIGEGKTIFICEGEKSADALVALGLQATCTHAGASSFPEVVIDYFAGAKVCVVPDCDVAGWSYAKKVVSALVGVVASLRVLDLELPFDGDDAFEFVMDGNTKDDLIKRVKDAPQILTVDDFVIPQRYVVDSVDSGLLDEDGVPPLEVAREDVVDVEGAAVVVTPMATKRFKVEDWNQIQDEKLEWLIEGIIPKKSFVAMYAPPASFKSFVALDMAHSIASGEDWMGHPTNPTMDGDRRQGCILYLAGEGFGGMGARVKALKIFKDSDGSEPILIVRHQINLRSSDEDYLALIESVNEVLLERNWTIDLIIVDTLMRASGGGFNENSSEDMGMIVNKMGELMQYYNCALMAIHHSGKDVSRGLRGHSSLLGAVDTELEIVRVDNAISFKDAVSRKNGDVAGQGILTVTKQKDGEDGKPIGFEVVSVEISVGSLGIDSVMSLAVRPSPETVEAAKKGGQGGRKKNVGTGENQRLAYEIVKTLTSKKDNIKWFDERPKYVCLEADLRSEFKSRKPSSTSSETLATGFDRATKSGSPVRLGDKDGVKYAYILDEDADMQPVDVGYRSND